MTYPFASLYGPNYSRGNNEQIKNDAAMNEETQDALMDENAETANGVGKQATFKNIAMAMAVVLGLVVFFGVGR